VVAVGVHHDIGAELHRAVESREERTSKSALYRQPQYLRPVRLRHLYRPIRAAVVDHQRDDAINARH
jgi:hypothetical protein